MSRFNTGRMTEEGLEAVNLKAHVKKWQVVKFDPNEHGLKGAVKDTGEKGYGIEYVESQLKSSILLDKP